MINEPNPTSCFMDWKPEDDVVVFMAQDFGTGIRQDDELINATETIHRLSQDGTGILLSPRDIAEIRLSSRDTWTPAQLADTEFEVRRALLPAVIYDRGNGRRLEGTMVMPLNTDTGSHATDVAYVAFVNLEGSISAQKVGTYGCFRILPSCVDRRGVLHEIKLNARGFIDAGTIHPGMLEGFVKGYKHLEDACDDADALRNALTKIREAHRANEPAEEREFVDRTAPRNIGY